MHDDTFHSQSTKQMYKVDIEESINQKTVYKNYEYFDDYSYSNSTEIGVYIRPHKNNNMLDIFFFQDKGPTEEETLRKLLEWRRSGNSNEIGHKGGGNKRNIFGFKSDKTSIYCRTENDTVICCEVKPNSIYNLASSSISEQDFRNKVDTSEYIKLPEKKDLDDLPKTYNDNYNKIYQESGIEPNYLIRMELKNAPDEYINENKWKEYIKQVRAKQYNIPIKFKNEKLGMTEYIQYENIDLLGINNIDKDKTIELYISEQNQFYYKENNEYINFDNGNKEEVGNLIKWGDIYMFVTNEEHSKNSLSEYNKDIDNTLKGEDVYGVYFKINDKFTNYKPIDGNLLGVSKNNGIKTETTSNSSRFRFVFIPHNNTCTADKFNQLITTHTIKASSCFLEKSPYRKIIKKSMEIFRGEKLSKPKPKPKPKPNPMPKKNIGGVYIVYISHDIYKFGMVETYDKLDTRINKHKAESITTVKNFANKDIVHKNATIIYKNKTCEPKGYEEKIYNLLIEDSANNNYITLFKKESSNNTDREYFKCTSLDHLIQEIIPKIDN